jgi:hypothetical protein
MEENTPESLRKDLEESFSEQTPQDSPGPKEAAKIEEPASSPAPAEPSVVEAAPAAAEATPTAPTPTATPEDVWTPASWKPLAREKWASLDPEIKAEVKRRELEINSTLRASAEARRFAEEFSAVISPYAHFIQQDGGTPIQTVSNMMQVAATLRTGHPTQRAALIADIVQQFGVDIGLLDQQLTARVSGTAPAQDPMAHVHSLLQNELAPVKQFMQELQQRKASQAQEMQSSVLSEIEQFEADPKNEFFADVRDDVADLLEGAAKHGIQMSLQTAYNRAIMRHPQIGQLIEQRTRAQAVSEATAAARRAQEASASLSSTAAPNETSEPMGDDIRSTLMASMKQLSKV